jgi:hypothetical protein
MLAGQQLAAGHVAAQGTQDDLDAGFGLVLVALVFEHQGEGFKPAVTGFEPARQPTQQTAQAEQQALHLIGGGGQGQTAGVALRRGKPGRGSGVWPQARSSRSMTCRA